MVGGGPGAFIGEVHRTAVRLTGQAELVAGAFSSDAEKSRRHGQALGVKAERAYGSFEEMAEKEAALPEGERIDFVSIVTPNHLHFRMAKAFIEKGFHVVCDKPMTVTLDDAEALCRLVEEQGILFCLTHNYSGYPMVKEARALVEEGALGPIRKVVVEYAQDWLADKIEAEGNKQASWRTDPKKAGAGALGDIGSHAEHLARYVTGLDLDRLCADVSTFVKGRAVDDDVSMLLRYASGAKGVLLCSQVSTGEENGLRLRVYGTEASLAWAQEDPNYLHIRRQGQPEEIRKRGNDYLSDAAQRASRLPPGHPEAFFEAFANVYLNATDAIAARLAGETPDALALDFPTVEDGARGVHFIQTALKSGREEAWVDAAYTPPVSAGQEA